MSDADLQRAVRALPHFRMLPPELLLEIVALTTRRTRASGDVLFHEGEPCEAFFGIESGGVKLYRVSADGREKIVHDFHAGATFAEAALLSFGRYPVSAVVTETPTVLLEFGGERFLRRFREDQRLASAMVASLSMRLVELVERVDELSLVQAGARLARWLLRQPASATKPAAVELDVAKKDLAARLAMTPETLSRLLRRWQEDGWIESDRTRIVLREPGSLLALADGTSDPDRGRVDPG